MLYLVYPNRPNPDNGYLFTDFFGVGLAGTDVFFVLLDVGSAVLDAGRVGIPDQSSSYIVCFEAFDSSSQRGCSHVQSCQRLTLSSDCFSTGIDGVHFVPDLVAELIAPKFRVCQVG